jgi:hypothetical protein
MDSFTVTLHNQLVSIFKKPNTDYGAPKLWKMKTKNQSGHEKFITWRCPGNGQSRSGDGESKQKRGKCSMA